MFLDVCTDVYIARCVAATQCNKIYMYVYIHIARVLNNLARQPY